MYNRLFLHKAYFAGMRIVTKFIPSATYILGRRQRVTKTLKYSPIQCYLTKGDVLHLQLQKTTHVAHTKDEAR